MPLAAGRLGPYEIVCQLGAGGMGEVYKARDTRLGRELAIKVLPTAFTFDRERVRRFQQEARAASMLNHPHIISIFETGEVDSVHFIAMELVDGSPLLSWIRRVKPNLTRIIDVLVQIADATATAHDAGIVHRDIKPSNLLVTTQGYAKVVDFGLAKLIESTDSEQTQTMGETISRLGTVLGTAPYMSPEQAGGRPVDARSDIFSLGAVLYEAITGRKAFEGDTTIDILHQVVHATPAQVSDSNAQAPFELQWIADKALAKDVAERYQSMRDLSADLRRLRHRLESTTAAKPAIAGSQGRAIRPAVAAVLGAVTVAGVWLGYTIRRPSSAEIPFTSSEMAVARLTAYGGMEYSGAISPDGKYFAFVSDQSGRRDIWVRQISGGDPVQITHDELIESDVVYAPDGGSLYYTATPKRPPGDRSLALGPGESIWRVASLGGLPRKIIDGRSSPSPSFDGRRLAFVRNRSAIEVAQADGTQPREIYRGAGVQGISWSLDGRWLALSEQGLFQTGQIYIIDPNGQQKRQITHFPFGSVFAQVWLPDSKHLLFSRSFDRGAGPMSDTRDLGIVSIEGGATRRLTLNVNARLTSPSLSADGKRLVASMETFEREIWTVPLLADPKASANAARRVLPDLWNPWWTHVSRTGTTVLFNSSMTGSRNLWTMPLDGKSAARQITSLGGNAITHAALSPDGSRVAYTSVERGNPEIWIMNLDGSNLVRLNEASGFWPTWSPDSRWIAFSSNRDGGKVDLWKASVDGGPAVRINDLGGYRSDWNPIDNRIVYWATPSRLEVADADTGKVLRSIPFSPTLPVWSPDGRRFSAVQGDGGTSVWVFDANSGSGEIAVQFPDSFHMVFRAAWTDQGRSLIVNRQELTSHIVLFEDF